MESTPSATYSVTLRVEHANEPEMLGELTSTIGQAGGMIGAVDMVQVRDEKSVRDLTVNARDSEHGQQIADAVDELPNARVINFSDRTFLMHLGGKIEVEPKMSVRSRDVLSMAYTPGVARVCRAIAEEKERVFDLTVKRNCVAVVSDGTAVLGLGDIGPEAAIPVMEGKAMLFKDLADVDAFPICLDLKETDEIVEAVRAISPVFGGINLEDISSPRCFEIEQRLKEKLDIPVFHDDQHGTAVVVLAALINALKVVGKELEDIKVVLNGPGASGIACIQILLSAGVKNIVGSDSKGIVHTGRDDLEEHKRWLAENTNPEGLEGDISNAVEGADFFLGLSVPNVLTTEHLDKMAKDPIIFALANPDPEIAPEEAKGRAAVMATGRSDYPNQINNTLCFPGLFRGVLNCRAKEINEEMKLAAARALASVIPDDNLSPDYIIPTVFDERIVPAMAEAVEEAAHETGAAREGREEENFEEPPPLP